MCKEKNGNGNKGILTMTDKHKFIVWHTETLVWEEIIEAKDEDELIKFLNNKWWEDTKADIQDSTTEWELCDD